MLTKYIIKEKRGIDDLKGLLPEQGLEYWTDEDW